MKEKSRNLCHVICPNESAFLAFPLSLTPLYSLAYLDSFGRTKEENGVSTRQGRHRIIGSQIWTK